MHVENLTKVYAAGDSGGGIRDLGFDVAAGEFYTLLGPSGCGKTTTLRSVAGLEEPSAGRMTIANQMVFDADARVFVPANQRSLGMVFQSYAIWPHMDVFENVAFPLRMAQGERCGTAEIRKRVTRTLETRAPAERRGPLRGNVEGRPTAAAGAGGGVGPGPAAPAARRAAQQS